MDGRYYLQFAYRNFYESVHLFIFYQPNRTPREKLNEFSEIFPKLYLYSEMCDTFSSQITPWCAIHTMACYTYRGRVLNVSTETKIYVPYRIEDTLR